MSWSSTISYGGVTYSVPHTLVDDIVWVRVDGDEVVAVHTSGRAGRGGPASPVDARHPGDRRRPLPAPAAGSVGLPTQAGQRGGGRVLAIGEGARTWLVEAASAGASRVKAKMAEAVTLARLHGPERVDWALGHAAMFARFAEGDLASILAANPPGARRAAGEVHSLQAGTGAWAGFGGDEETGR